MTPLELRKQQTKQREQQTKELKDWKKQTRIDKNIIETFIKNNNSIAIKLLFYFSKIENIEPKNIDFNSNQTVNITLKIQELLDFCNIDKRTLRNNLKYLTETSIEVYEEKENVLCFMNILPKIIMNKNEIIITMFQYIIHKIRDVVDNYVTIDVENLMKLKHKHSLKMIQILELINGFRKPAKKQKTFSLEEMNGLFGTNYKKSIDFENNILIKSKEELDSISKLSFDFKKTFESGKTGRPKFKDFIIILKDNHNRQLKLF